MQTVAMCTFPHRLTCRVPPSILHGYSLDPCHRTFEHATIVDETSFTNLYTTSHPHHSNKYKQHLDHITHQW